PVPTFRDHAPSRPLNRPGVSRNKRHKGERRGIPMSSVQILEQPAVSMAQAVPRSLSSIAPRWILANVLPQALLVAAAAVYLSVNGISFAGLIARETLDKLDNAGWALIAVALAYPAMIVWMRGAVLRPLVPRFSVLGWVPAAFFSGAATLLAAVGGG